MRNITIGIITIAKVNNYGAELQAFALQYYLKTKGYAAEIIDYLYYKHPEYKHTSQSKSLWNKSVKVRIKYQILKWIALWERVIFRKHHLKKEQLFRGFHQKNTQFSSVCYNSINSLYQDTPQYDVYMVGSDQVWNPMGLTNLEPYFLTFAPANSKKVSYASSFGVSSLDEFVQKDMKRWLSSFAWISVREQQGVRIAQSLGCSSVTHVLDPTLLLTPDQWDTFATVPDNVPNSGYVLLYALTPSRALKEATWSLAQSMGLPVVQIATNVLNQDKRFSLLYNVGPSEFLWLFKNASFVMTNSFHGTAFSINFSIPFFVVQPSSKTNNSRQLGLLQLCGLSHRMVSETDNIHLPTPLQIDFTPVQNKLHEHRIHSYEYLTNALQGTV